MRAILGTLAVLALVAGGCQNKGKQATIEPDSSVADIAAPSYTPPPAEPVFAPVTPVADVTPVASTSGTYTIKKGDTLYSIARNTYGDGKQWQRIASANPGINPHKLRVGQTIVLP
jgi:5'-nucleotidase/UDP-sugar diphosphatase